MFEELGSKLSSFGNSVKQGAINFGDSVKQSTSNFSGNMQLKSKIEAAKKEIQQAYTELGEQFYMQSQGSPQPGYEPQFERITSLYKTIESAQQEMRALSGVRTCPQCGADVQRGFAFCTNCGKKMETEEEKKPEVKKSFCPNCGKEVPEGYAFCNFCGTKLAPPASAPAPAPAFEAETPAFEPEAPSFEAEAPAIEPEAPAFEAEAPSFEPKAPAFEPTPAPVYEPVSEPSFAPEEPAVFEEEIPDIPEYTEPAPAAPAEPVCPQCGNKVRPDAVFCNMCGRALK